MKILAFDTSAVATSVALVDDGKLLAEVLLNSSINHSVTLMPTIDFLMGQVGWTPQELDRIAVAQGPGSYTGLRIAVTAAKTLAWTLKTDLVGLSSLQAIASRLKTDRVVVPLMNARRGMVYAGVYQSAQPLLADQHLALSELLEKLSTESDFLPASYKKAKKELIFTGDAALFREEILRAFPEATIIAEAPDNLPSAFELARLASLTEVSQNQHDFNPIYLKKVEAEEKWEEASGLVADDKDLVSRV